MSFLLTDADYLSRAKVFPGVSETVVEEGPILNYQPFEGLDGHTQVSYNRENSLGIDSQFYNPNEEVTESAPTYTNVTDTLKIMRDREEIDHFLYTTKGAVQAVLPTQIASLAKRMWRRWNRNYYYGNKSNNAKQFDGLHALVSTSGPDQSVAEGSGATPGALSLANLSIIISLVKPGKPDALLMNRNMLRRLSEPYIANVGYRFDKNTFGDFISQFAEIPIIVDDFINQVETPASGDFSSELGSTSTSIFAIKFGRGSRQIPGTGNVFNVDGVLGIQDAPMQIRPPHDMEKKDGVSILARWYSSLILGSPYSLSRLGGISDAAAAA